MERALDQTRGRRRQLTAGFPPRRRLMRRRCGWCVGDEGRATSVKRVSHGSQGCAAMRDSGPRCSWRVCLPAPAACWQRLVGCPTSALPSPSTSACTDVSMHSPHTAPPRTKVSFHHSIAQCVRHSRCSTWGPSHCANGEREALAAEHAARRGPTAALPSASRSSSQPCSSLTHYFSTRISPWATAGVVPSQRTRAHNARVREVAPCQQQRGGEGAVVPLRERRSGPSMVRRTSLASIQGVGRPPGVPLPLFWVSKARRVFTSGCNRLHPRRTRVQVA